MPMRNCDRCLENIWDFEKLPDGYTQATCRMCSNEVIWKPYKKSVAKKKKEIRKKQKKFKNCRACETKLILRETRQKPSQLRKKYYYTAYYWCSNCKRMYLSDRFKVWN